MSLEIGTTVTVNNPYTKNQVGGTEMIKGTVQAQITDSFYDYETGQRYIGALVREEDIELSREVGKSNYTPEHYKEKYGEKMYQDVLKEFENYDPKKVFFGQFNIAK